MLRHSAISNPFVQHKKRSAQECSNKIGRKKIQQVRTSLIIVDNQIELFSDQLNRTILHVKIVVIVVGLGLLHPPMHPKKFLNEGKDFSRIAFYPDHFLLPSFDSHLVVHCSSFGTTNKKCTFLLHIFFLSLKSGLAKI